MPMAMEKIVAVKTSEIVFIASCHRPIRPIAISVPTTAATTTHLRAANHARAASTTTTSGQGALLFKEDQNTLQRVKEVLDRVAVDARQGPEGAVDGPFDGQQYVRVQLRKFEQPIHTPIHYR